MALLCLIFKSASGIYARRFEYSSACDVYVRLETTGAAIKITRGTTNNQ